MLYEILYRGAIPAATPTFYECGGSVSVARPINFLLALAPRLCECRLDPVASDDYTRGALGAMTFDPNIFYLLALALAALSLYTNTHARTHAHSTSSALRDTTLTSNPRRTRKHIHTLD